MKCDTAVKENAQGRGPLVPLVSLINAAVRLGGKVVLENTNWHIAKGQFWAITGPNGAGKSTLMKALAGRLPIVHGCINSYEGAKDDVRVEFVSEENVQRLITRTEGVAGSRYFTSGDENIVTVRTYLSGKNGKPGDAESHMGEYCRRIGVMPLLDREIRFLSSGELKRMAVIKGALENPHILIVEEPFDGVDEETRGCLCCLFEELVAAGMTVIIATHRIEEIPSSVSHVMALQDCRVVWKGRRPQIPHVSAVSSRKIPSVTDNREANTRGPDDAPDSSGDEFIIDMRDIRVRYADTTIIDGLDWRVKQGEHWAVVGPNGAGKSVLLSLIVGDNPQAYANDLYLFGRKKGSGETIFELRKRIGFVSTELQVRYPRGVMLEDVVISGRYDSYGLYRRPREADREAARTWIERLGLSGKESVFYRHLSWGEQRLSLIARAMVKNPELLILDEPCQGLDPDNRRRFVDFVNDIDSLKKSTILYVAHFKDEIPRCIEKVLRMDGGRGESGRL